MIRCSKTSLQFSNKNKIETISKFIDEYKIITQKFIDILWTQKGQKIPSLIPKNITDQAVSWMSQRAIQCAAKQASGIVRGTLTKQKRRLYKINQLNEEGKFKRARKLKVIYDKVIMSQPIIKNISPELDSRFIEINLESNNSFDGWISISSIGNKIKLNIPIKKTSHFKKGIRLSKDKITFNFEIVDPEKKKEGDTIGIDIGIIDVITCSNGVHSKKDIHGHDLSSIQQKLSRKQKGSLGFKRTQEHRSNYINWSINQLDFDNIKVVNLEDVKNLRYGKNSSRYLSHFVYTQIFDKLESFSFEQGVLVQKKSPTYTSQRCSKCGWVRKRNRNGKLFKCEKCGFVCDSDLNASINLSFDLPCVSKAERLLHKNRQGFYLHAIDQKPIVSDAQQAKDSYFS
jgi:transposase